MKVLIELSPSRIYLKGDKEVEAIQNYIYNKNSMKKLLYIIIPIGILAVLNMLTDSQYIIVGWIFIGIWIIKILTEK